MIKRVLTFALLIITAVSTASFSASAAENMTIGAKSVSAPANPGTEVKVPVSFKNNPGYGFGYITVTWNQSVLELTGVNYTKLAPAQASAAPISNKGLYKVSYGDMLSRDNFTGNGEAFTLVFKTTASASAGKYKIELKEPEIYDKDIVEIKAEASSAEVTLTGGSSNKAQPQAKNTEEKATEKETQKPAGQSKSNGGSNQSSKESKVNISVDKPAANVKTGDTVRIPVRFTENTGYSFGSVVANWDKSALALTKIEYTGLAPEPEHNIPVENNGSFHILFGKENATENITGTGTAFTLVFKVADAEKAKNAKVTFSDLELFTHDLSEVKVGSEDSSVITEDKKTENKTVPKGTGVNPSAGGAAEDKLSAGKSGGATADSKSGGSPVIFIILGLIAAAVIAIAVINYNRRKNNAAEPEEKIESAESSADEQE